MRISQVSLVVILTTALLAFAWFFTPLTCTATDSGVRIATVVHISGC